MRLTKHRHVPGMRPRLATSLTWLTQSEAHPNILTPIARATMSQRTWIEDKMARMKVNIVKVSRDSPRKNGHLKVPDQLHTNFELGT